MFITFDNSFLRRNVNNITIRAGSTFLNEEGIVLNASSTYVHPLYNPVTFQNNLGLIKLEKPLEFNENIQSIRLPHPFTDVLGGAKVAIAGWGFLEATGQFSQVLQQTETHVVTRESCINAYSNFLNEVTVGQICTAGVDDGGVMPCWGDNGGPVVFNGEIIAIIAWGANCGQTNLPAVNERVSQHVQLIDAVKAGWELDS